MRPHRPPSRREWLALAVTALVFAGMIALVVKLGWAGSAREFQGRGATMPGPVALVATLIIDRLTCLSCIAAETKMSPPNVEAALSQIHTVMVIYQDDAGPCHFCGKAGPVVSLKTDLASN